MTGRLRAVVTREQRPLPGRKFGKAAADKVAATQAVVDRIVLIEGDIQEAMEVVRPFGEIGGRHTITPHRYHMGNVLKQLTLALRAIEEAASASIDALGEENLR